MARLLIVEDHPELASLMVAAAESRGHEATAVHTGEAALALLRPAAFHAAVVDLLLPDMRGSAVLSALRDHAIPAVAVSGVFKGDRFAREATEVHGARAFFEKPFELLQLLESVEQLCGLTRPLPPPPSGEDEDEVVVFEDAALLDMDDEPVFTSPEDEPGFTSSDDEPVFSSPAEEHAPVIEGLALVEEAQDPMGGEAPAEVEATPEPEPGPGPDEQAPAFAQGARPVTLKTEDLEELEGLEELASDDKTPTMALSSEELEALDALAQQIEEAPAPPPSAEELQALEALEPTVERATPLPSAEELEALEALAPATEAPAPPPPPRPSRRWRRSRPPPRRQHRPRSRRRPRIPSPGSPCPSESARRCGTSRPRPAPAAVPRPSGRSPET
ncbi:DNA-binding response regulator KdpE [Archangium gephyra]|uniref:DNA-binding response regulator KdpE n=1 Tax=Archangium gephyra TaxID=48 RepID=A0AAC8Q8R5_9BACT|nr:response regulator [Archangium gephyra]AKJ02849.1 DNA-binding response regulator KdpE [Archangium gephyra]